MPSLPEIIAMVIVINNNERLLVVLKCWFVTMLQCYKFKFRLNGSMFYTRKQVHSTLLFHYYYYH